MKTAQFALSQWRRGFTLIELLVVMFIMGLLAATLAVTLTPGQSRGLVYEAEQLAMVLEEGSQRARAVGSNYEWRPGASGYTLAQVVAAGETTSPPQEFPLTEGIRIQQVRADGEAAAASIVIPGRGVAGPASITLASADQEIDVYSEGLNRYSLSSPRNRAGDAKR
ncbi:MAG: gspH [Proteobacteria bacterium]|nr:gspH [Pseudomonadota bacterium]